MPHPLSSLSKSFAFQNTYYDTLPPTEKTIFFVSSSQDQLETTPRFFSPQASNLTCHPVNTPNLPPTSRCRLKYLLIAFHSMNSMNQKQPEPSPGSPGPSLSLGSMNLRSCCLLQSHLIFSAKIR